MVDFYIEGIPVYKDFLSTKLANYPGYAMTAEVIVAHETENHDKGADAKMHNRYLHNGAGGRMASWHFTVDDGAIYWHIPLDKTGWHAGDGQGRGNRKGIGIEHCENSDGDFKKTVYNGMALIRWIRKELGRNLPVEPHRNFSSFRKNCPSNILPYWDQYIKAIDVTPATSTPTPALPVPDKPKHEKVVPGGTYAGNSIVDYLISINADHSITNRKKLAKENGIANYTGSAIQNLQLLDKLRGNKNSRVDDVPAKSIVDMAIEVEEMKHGTGHDDRRKSLDVSQAVYDQVRAEVNRRAGIKTPATKTPAKPKATAKAVKAGDTVTTKTLYLTAYATDNKRKTPITGYVDRVDGPNGNWRNKIRLLNKRGGYAIGFTRPQDLQ